MIYTIQGSEEGITWPCGYTVTLEDAERAAQILAGHNDRAEFIVAAVPLFDLGPHDES